MSEVEPMGFASRDIAKRYKDALEHYLACGGEEALHEAYEIGRQAVASNRGLIDLINYHREALSAFFIDRRIGTKAVVDKMDAADRFLAESLSSFDMFHLRNREANASLRRMNNMLEDEAKRVAHALHDEAATLLATVYVDLSELARELPVRGVERINRVIVHLDQVRDQLRRLSHEVRPPILDTLGLMPALRFLSDGVHNRTGLAVTVEGTTDRPIPQPAKIMVYRIAQEALTNITRYARATHAHIQVEVEGGSLNCLIEDNGKGFDVSSLRRGTKTPGLGLIGIEDRVRALNGKLAISSERGKGTRIQISIPLDTQAKQA